MSALNGPPSDICQPAPTDPSAVPFPPFEADAGGDSPIARKRRDEIVTAATEVIASEGLHKLSLGRIEAKCKMSRGQLTYYFKSKEDILLAVFDRMLAGMIRENIATAERDGVARPGEGRVIDRMRYGLDRMMAGQGPERTELLSLVHTFMAQVRYRPDYRRKLAAANAGWRQHVAADITASAAAPLPVPAPVVASIVMALFQGLGGQLAVDPEAFDRQAALDACLRILAPLLGTNPPDARGDT